MSIRRVTHTSKRAFRPAYDDLEGRRLMSMAPVSAASQGLVGGPSSPAIAGFNDKIYMAVVNGSSGDRIAITSSSDGGAKFGNLVDFPERTNTTPALATFDGRLYIAWRGTNSAHELNVESSTNGVNWGDKVTLPESSIAGPALASVDGRLYISWTGTDPAHELNVESSADGVNFGNRVTLPESSSAGPCWPAPTDASSSPGRGRIRLTTSTSSRRPMG